MIKIDNDTIYGWEEAIRGMRNPMNSWDKSDSYYDWPEHPDIFKMGPNDHDLAMRLRNAGTDHRKYLRFITVYLDITAPLYWWKEFKTYRAGRKFSDPEMDIMVPDLFEMDIETNSCSTMHKIHEKEFTLDDFSHEQLLEEYPVFIDEDDVADFDTVIMPLDDLQYDIRRLNLYRKMYLKTKNKVWWWQMIQRLPSSYNQKRTVMLNYEVLNNMYKSRKNHKLDEWRDFCKWIETLPYSELITGEVKEEKNGKNQV